ncbi:MAG: response regulator [Candidatus Thorarchaeota archaeon]|nr:response regulator [Candidatus Thorarchaeota archaeon]
MNKGIILLVEDNPDDILLTQRALKRANILNDVVIARDGIEALQYLRCQGDFESRKDNSLPVVILLDLNMPRMGGQECLKEIRSDNALKSLPVVILTSSSEDQDIMESYNLGANSYIRKPVDFDQFVKAIQTLGLY